MWNQKQLKICFTFFHFGSKRGSPLKINCENFTMGCLVGFCAILLESLAFTTLDDNCTAHSLYLCTRSCDAMYHVRERKSKLKLFYQLFMDLFCHILLTLGLNACLKAVWNYCYIYCAKWLSTFQVLKLFSFFLWVTCIIIAHMINTDIWQAIIVLATKSWKQSAVSHLKMYLTEIIPQVVLT